MIYDKLENLGNYAFLSKVKRFLDESKGKILENGKYVIDDNCYLNVSQYETGERKDFEVHREYIDVQMVLSGKEYVFVQNIENGTPITEYDAQADIMFYKADVATEYMLDESNFIVLDVEDLHNAGVSVENPETIKKYVFKIKRKCFANEF